MHASCHHRRHTEPEWAEARVAEVLALLGSINADADRLDALLGGVVWAGDDEPDEGPPVRTAPLPKLPRAHRLGDTQTRALAKGPRR